MNSRRLYVPKNHSRPTRWFRVKNTDPTGTGNDAPGYAVLMITGRETSADGLESVTVTQPDVDNLDPALICISGPSGVYADGYGEATCDWPYWISTDPDGPTPANGDLLGTIAGHWYLGVDAGSTADHLGFVAWYGEAGGTDSSPLALAMPEGSSGGGSSGDVALYRVDGDFIKDDPLISTACRGSYSPNCYFPVSKASLSCSGWTFSGSFWWVDWYGQEAVTDLALINGTTPQPIITAGGATLVWGKSAGFAYSPAGSGSRPVLMGEALARFWSGGCQIVDGVPQFTGVQAGS